MLLITEDLTLGQFFSKRISGHFSEDIHKQYLYLEKNFIKVSKYLRETESGVQLQVFTNFHMGLQHSGSTYFPRVINFIFEKSFICISVHTEPLLQFREKSFCCYPSHLKPVHLSSVNIQGEVTTLAPQVMCSCVIIYEKNNNLSHSENFSFLTWIYVGPFSYNCLQKPKPVLKFLSRNYNITRLLCFTLTFPLLSLAFSPGSHLLLNSLNTFHTNFPFL